MKNRALFNWLEYEWRISNAPKYQQYFKEWVENLLLYRLNILIK